MRGIALTAMTTTSGFGAGWGNAFNARIAAGYDDNVRLSAADPQTSSNVLADLSAAFLRHGDSVDFSLNPHALLMRYPELHLLNHDDVDVNAALTQRGERFKRVASVSYLRDSTLTSERGLTGLTETNRPHETVGATFSNAVQATQRFTISGQGSWTANHYADASGTGLVDYDYGAAAINADYSLTARSSLSFDGSYGKLIVPTTDAGSRSLAANIGWQTLLAERWKVSLSAGPIRVESDFIVDNGTGYSMSLRHESEVNAFIVSLSRDVIPTGRGVLSKRERASLSWSYNVTERLSAQATAQWIKNREVAPDFGVEFPATRYANVSSDWQWQCTPSIALYASFAWATQRQDNISDSAKGYRMNIGIAWRSLGRRL